MNTSQAEKEPTRAEVDALDGATVLEFGTGWCGWCRAAQPLIAGAFQSHESHAGVRHLKVEDGPGRPLGRSYRVKLWPTLVFLKDGQELARIVRPASEDEIQQGLKKIAG